MSDTSVDTPPCRFGLRILMVEDHGDTSRVMAKLLQGQGHEVRTADGVGTALAAAAEQEFDLLISDIRLPDGTGLELIKQLLASRPIKGIAVSGYSDDEDIRRSHDAGFSAHVTKPIDFQKLQILIKQIA